MIIFITWLYFYTYYSWREIVSYCDVYFYINKVVALMLATPVGHILRVTVDSFITASVFAPQPIIINNGGGY